MEGFLGLLERRLGPGDAEPDMILVLAALRTGARDCVPKHRLDLLCEGVERALGQAYFS